MELKYFIFILALLSVIPLACLLMLSTKCMKACVFLLPICFWNYQSTAINFFTVPYYKGTALGYEISIIHLLSLALLIAMFLRQWPLKLLFPGTGLYILYFLICMLSIGASPNKMFSGFELMKMYTFFIAFLAMVNYFYMTHDFDSFFYGVATFITIHFFKSLEMKYILGKMQVKGIFLHQNSAAMFMCLIGPVFLARIINKKENFFKSAFWLVVFLMVFLCTLFTYSRGAIVCFPLGCAITILLSIVFHATPKTIIILCVTGILGICVASYSMPTIIKRFSSAPAASADMRKRLAEIAKNIMKDKPLLGCGLNNWGIVGRYPRYNPFIGLFWSIDGGLYIGIVETTYLLVGAECGLLGLGSMLCWFFYYLFQAVYQSFRWRKTEYLYLLVGLAGGFSSNYFQSTLEWCLKQQINFCLLLWCFAIVAVFVQGGKDHTFLSKLEYIAERKKMLKQRHSEASATVHQPTHS